jgi:hypothetical protein
MKLSLLVLAALALPVAVGCAAEAGSTDEASPELTASVTAGSFKLYNEPHARPNPSCDIHTKLVLSADRGSKAHLEEVVGGFCEIAVFPNTREYSLRLTDTSCGSKVWEGTRKDETGQRWTLKVTDNRTRLCEDVIAALLVVDEGRVTENGEEPFTKFSKDDGPGPVEGDRVTVEGKLAQVVAIGGETTGFAIAAADGVSHELILDPAEQKLFEEGKNARVKGSIKMLSGAELPSRAAVDVSSLLLCPSSGTRINCMPGPNVRLSPLCGAENRAWASASCEGVTFVF